MSGAKDGARGGLVRAGVRVVQLSLLGALCFSGCKSEKGSGKSDLGLGGGGSGSLCDPGDRTDDCDLDDYFLSLPTWEEFAYAETPKLPTNGEGQEVALPNSESVDDVLDGDNLTKVCTTERVSFYDTPSEYVMFATPGILYPGALIQGKSLRDGGDAGDLLPLNVEQRSPVRVSIPSCAFAENFEETLPTQAGVASAIGSILDRAKDNEVDCLEAKGSFNVETFNSETQRALSMSVAGKYLNFSASASASLQKSKTETTVAAVFRESLFTVRIQAPQSPSGWFSEDFTPDLLAEQVDLGRIGPNNIPAYVAEVTYGRMMMFTMTSEASSATMTAHLQAKYKTLGTGIEADVDASEEQALSRATYSAAYLGEGAGDSWLSSLDWRDYFSEQEVTASDAVPISFVIKSTRDDVPAVVQELTEYDRTTCVDKVAGAGTFEFGAKQTVDTGFSELTAKAIAVADLNGDRNEDIIWAAQTRDTWGECVIALSNGDGTFTKTTATFDNIPDERQGDFSLLTGDIDADGREDIILNVRGAVGANYLYIAFYKEMGGADEFVYSAEQNLEGSGGSTFDVRVAQVDGQRGDDLIWSDALGSSTANRTYIANALDADAEGFDLTTDQLFVAHGPFDHHQSNFSGYEYWHVADFTGDGLADMVWQDMDADGNRFYSALGQGDGFDFGSGTTYYTDWGGNWGVYQSFVGFLDDDGRADLIEPRVGNPWDTYGTYGALGTSATPFLTQVGYDGHGEDAVDLAELFPDPTMLIADVDGNGQHDQVIVKLAGETCSVGVGLATGSEQPFYGYTRKLQNHPDTLQGEWDTFQVFVGNVDGDDGNNREDLLFISGGDPSIVYAGRARPSE